MRTRKIKVCGDDTQVTGIEVWIAEGATTFSTGLKGSEIGDCSEFRVPLGKQIKKVKFNSDTSKIYAL